MPQANRKTKYGIKNTPEEQIHIVSKGNVFILCTQRHLKVLNITKVMEDMQKKD